MSFKRIDIKESVTKLAHENPSATNSDQDPLLMSKKERRRYLKESTHVGGSSQLLLSFSIIQNSSKLLSFTTRQTELHCINGIRVISLLCIIWGHTLSNVLKPSNNGFEELYKERIYGVLEAAIGYLSVDTFFVLSGMLVAFSIMPRLKAKGVNLRFLANVYLLRYLRLTPPYLLVIVTYTQLFQYLSSGPVWPQDGLDMSKCYQFPWNNFLYINNFLSVGPMCMNWSWYLAVDMQFFVIFPVVLLPLYFFDWKGMIVPILLAVGSMVAAGVVSYSNNLPPIISPLDSDEAFFAYMKLYYLMPYTRYGPYAVGMVLGYVLDKYKCRAHLPKSVVAVGWISSFVTVLVVIYSIYLHEKSTPMSNEVTAFYNAVHRTAWGLAISWIIFACCTGYGGFHYRPDKIKHLVPIPETDDEIGSSVHLVLVKGSLGLCRQKLKPRDLVITDRINQSPVKTALSCNIFVPVGRLTYMVYLIHLIIINYVMLSLQQTFYANGHLTTIFYFSGFCVLCFALAFCLCLAYEAPIVNLMKIMRQPKGKHLQSIEESRL